MAVKKLLLEGTLVALPVKNQDVALDGFWRHDRKLRKGHIMRLIVLGFLSVLLLLNGCGGKTASFKESDIVVLTSESVPPNFQGDAQKITKLSTKIVQELFKRMSISPVIKVLPWADAYQQTLNENKTVLFSVVQTGARRNQFKWVGPLMIENGTEFYIAFNKNTPSESIAEWDQALSDMKKDGSYRRIITQYNQGR